MEEEERVEESEVVKGGDMMWIEGEDGKGLRVATVKDVLESDDDESLAWRKGNFKYMMIDGKLEKVLKRFLLR